MPRWTGPRGSFDHPASALNLRLVLAGFGLVFCAVAAILTAIAGWTVFAVILGVAAVVALIDIFVILRRRAQRGGKHSLFE
jgi:hypothetical protein